jgi:TldD protein
MRDRLQDALKKSDADYADIRIQDITSSWINFRGPELDSIGSARTLGGIVRALFQGGWGYATFNDLEGLDQQVREACESARLVGKGTTDFAPVEPVVAEVHACLEKDFRQIPLEQKKSTLEEYNQIVLKSHPKIQTSQAAYGDSFTKFWFASSQGAYIEDEQPDTYVFTVGTARDGDNVQTAFEGRGGYTGYQLAEGFHERAGQSAKRAVDLLSAPPVAGGKYTVIIDPRMAGVFIHEAFGHLSESDFVYENDRMKDLMQLGKRFGSDILNVVDDGAMPGGLGTHPYDFEGTPTRKNYLIKDGILTGRLHSRETAAKMGEAPTGNARAVRYEHPPIVRMTNTYIEQGTSTFEDMIRDVKLGVYAIDAFGGQTEMEMFTFSAAYAYMIRDGQVAEMVRDVVLTGNVFETLLNVDMLSNRVEFAPGGPGGCGKNGQFPLRVGFGGPHVRIQNVVIGGRQ